MSFEFNNPHTLWLALLIPLYLILSRRRGATAAVRYPSIRNIKRLPKSLRQRCRFIIPLMRCLALLLLIVVLARPVRQLETQELPSEGIAMAMLLDRSGSMGDPDGKLRYEDKLSLRIDVAKEVFRQFIEGDDQELKGRPNDLIGLVTFATYPQTDHPFSLDHPSLLGVVEKIESEKPFLDELGRPTDDPKKAGKQTDEKGRPLTDAFGRSAPRTNPMQFTDLKKAIEYTADKLQLLEQDLERSSGQLRKYNLQNRVLMLLTDGEPTVADARRGPDYPDEETVKKLTDTGVRVYFIQILARERYRERPDGTVEVIMPRRGGFFAQLHGDREAALVNQAIEEARKLARRTGGEHFLATSGDQLKDIYQRIDQLEKSEVGARTVFSHEERYRPYLLIALALLVAETVLAITWMRRVP
ncbi:MAG: vWA domain-containing protein [Planctomycetota bacterium]|jgi:Ca-activated chloride channel family protein